MPPERKRKPVNARLAAFMDRALADSDVLLTGVSLFSFTLTNLLMLASWDD